MLEAGWERGSEHASHWAAGPTPGTPAPPRRRKPVLRVVGEADRPLAGAGGTGRDAGLLVSRKGVIAEEKAEQPLENQAGTASVSLLLREPRAAVAALALEGARETPTGLLTPHWESPPPRGQCPSLPPTPDMQGWTHQGDP